MIDYAFHGVNLGNFVAEVCQKCSQQFFSAETSDKIETVAKKRGVWGLCTPTKVGVSGNSLDIRISHKIASFVGLSKGSEVMIHPEGKKRLIIDVT